MVAAARRCVLLTFTLQQYFSFSCCRKSSSSFRSTLSSLMSGCREGFPMIFSLLGVKQETLNDISRCCDLFTLKKCRRHVAYKFDKNPVINMQDVVHIVMMEFIFTVDLHSISVLYCIHKSFLGCYFT